MRKRFRIEWLILIGSLLLIVLFLGMQQEQEEGGRRGDVRNRQSSGAYALYQWLQAMGYSTSTTGIFSRLPEPEGAVLWRLPQGSWSEDSRRPLDELSGWVYAGGIVISMDRQLTMLEGERVGESTSAYSGQRLTLPLTERRLTLAERIHRAIVLPPDAVPLLSRESGEVSAFYMTYGEGGVWYLLDEELFLNSSLDDQSVQRLLITLVEQLPSDARMIFDERRHAVSDPFLDRWMPGSLARAARSQPWGWGLYYSGILIGLWILLRGRAFGRPIRPRASFQRREAGEFARSMGWLYQRTGQQEAALRHLHSRLRRRLIRRYRLNPALDDGALADAAARLRPGVDGAALAAHLRALQVSRPTDRQMVALAQASDEWLARLEA